MTAWIRWPNSRGRTLRQALRVNGNVRVVYFTNEAALRKHLTNPPRSSGVVLLTPDTHTISLFTATTLMLPGHHSDEPKNYTVRRRMATKTVIEAPLRRENRHSTVPENPALSRFEVGLYGVLRIRKASGGPSTTVVQVNAVQQDLKNEEVLRIPNPKST